MDPPEMDPDALAKAFAAHYYTTFNTDREGMVHLYGDGSRLSYNGQEFEGAQNIAAKLASLPLQKREYLARTLDYQPSGHVGGYFVHVTGILKIPDEQHVSKFCQTFHLTPTQQKGSFYLLNDIFRSNCP